MVRVGEERVGRRGKGGRREGREVVKVGGGERMEREGGGGRKKRAGGRGNWWEGKWEQARETRWMWGGG